MKKKIILFTTMAALALASGCGNQQSAKDKKNEAETVVETTVEETKATATEAKIEETETTEEITKKANPLDDSAMLDEMFGPEQTDDVLDFKPEYIGSTQIETKYAIIDLEDGVTLTDEEIANVDLLFETIEDVTGLSFLEGKYGVGKKTTIQVYNVVASASADNVNKAIYIDKSCLDENFLAMTHELVHVLEFCYSYSGAYPFYSEGFAEYWTYKIGQHILDKDIKELAPYVDIDSFAQVMSESIGGADLKAMYDEDIEHWMDQGCFFAFSDSWPAYVYGRFFFMYIEDTYGNVNDFLKIYARIPFASTGLDENAGAAGRKFMEIEPYIKMMKVTYGEEVFDGFYPWMKNHEDLFEQYK